MPPAPSSDARAITVPTQVLISGSDFVVRHGPQHAFFVALGSRIKERHVLPGFFHDTLGERDRARAIDLVRPFLLRRFDSDEPAPDLRAADLVGYTRDEADALATPLSSLSPRGLFWAINRLSIRIGGWFSEGIATGLRTGFDSGSTLDYVYEDRPRGLGPIGRAIDRIFLDAIGWRGIRQRKLHLEELIGKSVAALKQAGRPGAHRRHRRRPRPLRAGRGRRRAGPAGKRAAQGLFRAQRHARAKAHRRQEASGHRYLHAGGRVRRRGACCPVAGPDLAIVSGLYELFSDNALIARSLGGLARAMKPGGLLVYTNQPWHPQLEMIARSLTSHRGGQAWVMRRRTQAEMDQLVEAAGFTKIEQRIDGWGIFTVSVARRV